MQCKSGVPLLCAVLALAGSLQKQEDYCRDAAEIKLLSNLKAVQDVFLRDETSSHGSAEPSKKHRKQESGSYVLSGLLMSPVWVQKDSRCYTQNSATLLLSGMKS